MSHEELIDLFGEVNMNYIFELRARYATFTVSRPSPDRRETTTISTRARKSKFKSMDNAGMRQPSHTKKQTNAVEKRVLVVRKYLKYQFDPTFEALQSLN